MSQEEPLENTHDDTNGSSTGSGNSSVRGNSGDAEPESLPEAKEVPKKKKPAAPTKKSTAGAGRSAAAKKAAATRKAKEERFKYLEERVAFFDNIYQQAEAEAGADGSEEPQEEEGGDGGGTTRPGDPGYHPGVGELEETEAVLNQGAGAGDMDSTAGASRAPATPQRRRFTTRRSGGAFNRRLYDKLAASQGTVVSARGKVGSRKQLTSLFRKVHRGMSDEEISRFAIGSIRQNQYA